MCKKEKKGHPFIIIFVAVATLVGLSFLPWGKLTNGVFKNFNLLSDLTGKTDTTTVAEDDTVDPALTAALGEKTTFATDTLQTADGDSVMVVIAEKKSRVDGKMTIEDYTPDQSGLKHLKAAVAARNTRPVRIAFVGDSYIEGDIITQQLRSLMQQNLGGNGVGYMPAHSEVAGFRRSVRHQNSGWTPREITETSKSKYFILPGRTHVASGTSSITLKGVDMPNLRGWNNTELVFIAPAQGAITVATDSVTQTFNIMPSQKVQSVRVPGYTTSMKALVNVPGLVMLGAWVNDSTGVTVDNMSVRGDSGITRRYLNTELSRDMAQFVDYDLVILEYGINALSAQQKNYSGYERIMGEVIERVRQCYPNADILLLGIGDRGHKAGAQFESMPTVPMMIAAQRQAARKHGILFWDIREAMGGDGAIIDWRNKKLVNADYIHLNFDGGRVIGTELYNSLARALNKK